VSVRLPLLPSPFTFIATNMLTAMHLNAQSTHPGALHADLYCADGVFDVANVAYYKDARVATELSIASDWERRTLWTGPLVSAPPLNSTAFWAYISFPSKFFPLQSSSLPP
jgi:hypothetical protein